MNDAAPATEPNTPREQFLTARQLAAILQVSESTVRRLARVGRIPAIRLTSRLTRYHLPSVRDALDGNTTRRPGASRRPNIEEGADDSQLTFNDLLQRENQPHDQAPQK